MTTETDAEPSDEKPEWLYRFGIDPETASDLETACEAAARAGFPHGISVRFETNRRDVGRARLTEVEIYFHVYKTGASPVHFTIELPHPVNGEAADRLNGLFGRGG